MKPLSTWFITVYFATIYAFSNFGPSESKAPSTLNPTVDTFVIVYPKDPNDSETIKETSGSLERICGSEHVETLQSITGELTWKVTLSDRKTLILLAEHPCIRRDPSLERSITEFYMRHEKRSDLTPRDDKTYNIVARDPYNVEETKATREFLNAKTTDPKKNIYEFTFPISGHVIGWGNVQLSEAGMKEVEAHHGVKPPLGDNPLIEWG